MDVLVVARNSPDVVATLHNLTLLFLNSLNIILSHKSNMSFTIKWEFENLISTLCEDLSAFHLPPLQDFSLPTKQQMTQLQICMLCECETADCMNSPRGNTETEFDMLITGIDKGSTSVQGRE